MKDRLLYLTIGLLVGIVVMQWTMPSANATIVTSPINGIVAIAEEYVLSVNGDLWTIDQFGTWLPIPVAQVQFIDAQGGLLYLLDKSGNYWALHWTADHWVNYGRPPIEPVSTTKDTWGGVKGKYDRNK
jgi:hypothetical protein